MAITIVGKGPDGSETQTVYIFQRAWVQMVNFVGRGIYTGDNCDQLLPHFEAGLLRQAAICFPFDKGTHEVDDELEDDPDMPGLEIADDDEIYLYNKLSDVCNVLRECVTKKLTIYCELYGLFNLTS